MARPRNHGMTENELLIMNILWERPSLSVASILAHLPRRPKPAYTSVLTVIQAMEKKGYVTHTQVGKAYVYESSIERHDFERAEVLLAAKRIFNGDPLKLAMNLIKDEHLSKEEIKKLKKLLETL